MACYCYAWLFLQLKGLNSYNNYLIMNLENIFALFNRLYATFFPLYRVFYFAYKRYSDRDKISIITQHVRPGMMALDIGANIGFYSRLLSRLVGKDGVVYAFEPDEDNCKFLAKTVINYPNVKIVKAACGEKNGSACLYRSKKMNVDHHMYKGEESRECVEVKMVSIDEYLSQTEKSAGLIKIDVQGYDCHVLRGMKKTIARSSNALIIGELWPYGLRQAGSSADEYLAELQRIGLDIKMLAQMDSKDFSTNDKNKYFYTDFLARRIGYP
jgi:FkbM family methyltransferase